MVMNLTDEVKAQIDAKTYEELLYHWRYAPMDDPWFQGEVGDYWARRMATLRGEPGGEDRHVAASKKIGWVRR